MYYTMGGEDAASYACCTGKGYKAIMLSAVLS